jgi:tRNA(Ile)-lysidine synthase
LNTGVNFSLDLPGDIFVTRSYDNLTFANCAADDKAVSYSYPIAIPGETKIPEIGALLQTVICNEPIDYKRVNRSSDIVLDLDSICGDLYVRNWHPGDRIYPLGLDGSKKVQDIFSDMKIPKCDRSRIPVITDTEKIIWIAGVLMSESVKVTQETHKYLRIIILMH